MFRLRSFGAKMVLLVTITSGVVAAVVCAVLVWVNYVHTRTMAIDHIQTLSRTMALHTAAALDFDDPEAGRETLAALRAVPQVAGATIFNGEGAAFAVYRRAGPPAAPLFEPRAAGWFIQDGWLVHVEPIRQEDRRVGSLQMIYDMSAITQRLQHNALLSLGASLIAMAAALAITARLQRVVTRPIAELVATTRSISERRDFSIRARKLSEDEIGAFTDAFNDMLEKLQRHEELLQAAHQRFRIAVDAAPNAMLMVDEQGRIVLVNRQTEEIFRCPREALIGRGIEELVPEWLRLTGDAGPAGAPASRDHGAVDGRREVRARRCDGSEFPAEIGLSPIQTDQGARVLSAIIDITDRKQHEEQMRLVMDELNHRVKNTLASVQGMVAQTLRTSPSPEAFSAALGERLRALARAHALLTRRQWEGASLKEMIEAELKPRLASDDQAGVEGPDVILRPKDLLALHMVIHELGTNAVKYGALSAEMHGRVRVHWRIESRDGEQWVHLDWIESGGPPVTPPTREGFGSQMIERAVAFELNGEAQLSFDGAGVRCTIAFPYEPAGAAWSASAS